MAKPRIRIRKDSRRTWGWSWYCPLCNKRSGYWGSWRGVLKAARIHCIVRVVEHVERMDLRRG